MKELSRKLNFSLVEYIGFFRNKKARYDIDQYLLKAGYNPSEIEEAWQTIQKVPVKSQKISRRKVLVLSLVGILLFLLVVGLNLSAIANHFGFALPYSNGLPYRILYRERTYITFGICAGANWCAETPVHCQSQEYLIAHNAWPLAQIDTIPTFFGSPHKVMLPEADRSKRTPLVLYVPNEGCYIAYALEGGP